MTVTANVAFGLKMLKLAAEEIRQRTDEALDARIRLYLRDQIRLIQQELKLTTIFYHPRSGGGADAV